MSNERPNPDSNGVSDPLVSQTYRETADESVPAELDRAVLDAAASAAKPQYTRYILWLRPLAWTATIGLCLAIVLELSRVPQPEPAEFEVPSTESGTAGEETLLDAKNRATKAEPRRQDLDSFASDAVSEKSSVKLENSLPASAPAAAEQNAMKRNRVGDSDESSPETLGSSSTESFKVQNPQLLQQAQDLARAHSENLVEPELPALRSVAAGSLSTYGSSDDCDEDATASPSSWLECIADLEKAGLVDAAKRERDLLMSTFPDFELP